MSGQQVDLSAMPEDLNASVTDIMTCLSPLQTRLVKELYVENHAQADLARDMDVPPAHISYEKRRLLLRLRQPHLRAKLLYGLQKYIETVDALAGANSLQQVLDLPAWVLPLEQLQEKRYRANYLSLSVRNVIVLAQMHSHRNTDIVGDLDGIPFYLRNPRILQVAGYYKMLSLAGVTQLCWEEGFLYEAPLDAAVRASDAWLLRMLSFLTSDSFPDGLDLPSDYMDRFEFCCNRAQLTEAEIQTLKSAFRSFGTADEQGQQLALRLKGTSPLEEMLLYKRKEVQLRMKSRKKNARQAKILCQILGDKGFEQMMQELDNTLPEDFDDAVEYAIHWKLDADTAKLFFEHFYEEKTYQELADARNVTRARIGQRIVNSAAKELATPSLLRLYRIGLKEFKAEVSAIMADPSLMADANLDLLDLEWKTYHTLHRHGLKTIGAAAAALNHETKRVGQRTKDNLCKALLKAGYPLPYPYGALNSDDSSGLSFDSPITALPLDNRTTHALTKNGLFTVAAVLDNYKTHRFKNLLGIGEAGLEDLMRNFIQNPAVQKLDAAGGDMPMMEATGPTAETSVDTLPLSNRIRNALRREHISKTADLLQLYLDDGLDLITGIGAGSILEINRFFDTDVGRKLLDEHRNEN